MPGKGHLGTKIPGRGRMAMWEGETQQLPSQMYTKEKDYPWRFQHRTLRQEDTSNSSQVLFQLTPTSQPCF